MAAKVIVELPCPDCEREMIRRPCKDGSVHYACYGRDPYPHRFTAFRKSEALAEHLSASPVPEAKVSLGSKARELLDRAERLG